MKSFGRELTGMQCLEVLKCPIVILHPVNSSLGHNTSSQLSSDPDQL